jgi:transketolase
MNFEAGKELGKANLDVFSQTLLSLAKMNRNILAVTSDSRGSGKLTSFASSLPGQIIEVGIAEQNLVGVSAGLASTGKIVFAVSPASFLTARSLEQIKNDVCYSDHPVKLVGISAGVSYGPLGSTHHTIHDLAVLRALNNITIIVPSDNFETSQAIKAAASADKPFYIRFGKSPMYHLHKPDTRFEVGKAITIRHGKDVSFIAAGETVYHALMAAKMLEEEGISCRVISMHTIKPLDTETVLQTGQDSRSIITVEEHSISGGLGEACASVLMQAGIHVPFKIVGFPDEDTVTGSQSKIFEHYGISAKGLAQTAKTLLNY